MTAVATVVAAMWEDDYTRPVEHIELWEASMSYVPLFPVGWRLCHGGAVDRLPSLPELHWGSLRGRVEK